MQSSPPAQAKSPGLDERPHLFLTKASSTAWFSWCCSSSWSPSQAVSVSMFQKRDPGMSSVGCIMIVPVPRFPVSGTAEGVRTWSNTALTDLVPHLNYLWILIIQS